MAEISYAALPKAEQKQIACELRPLYTIDELAELFGCGRDKIYGWTKHLRVDMRRSKPPKQVKTEEDFCHCEIPARDSHVDSFCQRMETCIYCTKPRQR